MFDDFRLYMIRELFETGIDNESIQHVMAIIDKASTEYDVNRKETMPVPISMTWQRVLVEYLACRSIEGLSNETLYNYRTTLSLFLSFVRKPIEDIKPNDIRLYLYQYQQQRNISNRTLDKLRNTIASFFRWAYNEERIERDPCASIQPIKYTITPRTALSQLELEYIRKSCGDIREKAIIETLYSTGCRVSELCRILKSDVDWKNQTIQVFGKGGKYRTVFINAKAYVTLQDYLKMRTDSDEHLFVSDRKPHGGLTRYAVEHIVSEISDRAYRLIGKRVTPHIFRHTTATTALQNGMPVQNISRMLGHSQIETTMVYAEVNNGDVQRDHLRYVI